MEKGWEVEVERLAGGEGFFGSVALIDSNDLLIRVHPTCCIFNFDPKTLLSASGVFHIKSARHPAE